MFPRIVGGYTPPAISLSPYAYKDSLQSKGLGLFGLSDTSTAFLVIAAGAAYLIWKMR